MKHLINSFQSHVGERGCHFYDDNACTFLSWKEVFEFMSHLPNDEKVSPFAERLADSLANYDPDSEFLCVQQAGKQVSVELYTQAS
jgi:hypothetical protein